MSTTLSSTRAPDAALRRALRIDGVCSTAAGAALLSAIGPVSSFTGMSGAVTAALGAGSALLGLSFLALSRVAAVRPAGVAVAAANAACTVATIVVAGFASPPLTAGGVAVILAAGAYTAAVALAQYRGVRGLG